MDKILEIINNAVDDYVKIKSKPHPKLPYTTLNRIIFPIEYMPNFINLVNKHKQKHKFLPCQNSKFAILEFLNITTKQKKFHEGLYKLRDMIWEKEDINILYNDEYQNYFKEWGIGERISSSDSSIDFMHYDIKLKEYKKYVHIFFDKTFYEKINNLIKNDKSVNLKNIKIEILNIGDRNCGHIIIEHKYWDGYRGLIAQKGIRPDWSYLKNEIEYGHIILLVHNLRIPYFTIIDNDGTLKFSKIENEDGIKTYKPDLDMVFMSSWEANIARLLNYLQIHWTYEQTQVLLTANRFMKLNVYKPDFLINNSTFLEIKGFWNTESLQKTYLFSKGMVSKWDVEINDYRLLIIDGDMYHSIDQVYSSLIENWEQSNAIKPKNDAFLVGITQPERLEFIKALEIGTVVYLERDKKNEFDNNAIKVVDQYRNMLGYLSKEWAFVYADKIDLGMKFEARVKNIEKTSITITINRTNFNENIMYHFLKPIIKE